LLSEVTDNRVFYRVDIDPIPPQLDPTTWTLKVHGKVNNPSTLTQDSLVSMPSVDEYDTLECVSNTINPSGGLISNAKWTGVPLAKVLNQAGVAPDAKYVVFRCGDGYSVGIPLDRALLPDAVLAYKMNDATLPIEHGFPLRAIVPGIYGMMNAKWITEIEVTDQVYLGYWQERGWSNDAQIKTTSFPYYPQAGATVQGPTPIAGVAFAGDRGISKVEVSVDNGITWNEAELKTPKSPYSWVLWAYRWNPTTTGTVTILVRAYDGSGQIQDPTAVQPFPNGGSGYSSIQVTVG
jgi:DMSO/TMAO reductase YedYZ molybdopterin-dependent catalytic subunit